MWFVLSLVTLLFWSGSDLFSKIGCRDKNQKNAHLKMAVAVGMVMGLHALYEIFFNHVAITWEIIWVYLPVALLYISSMIMGYLGLRYIELSISSPICNSSGALAAVMSVIVFGVQGVSWMQLAAVAVVSIGVICLGIVDSTEDEELRKKRQEASNYRYAKSWIALALPIAYCVLDAAGTFGDNFAIEKIGAILHADPDTVGAASANVAYELTFFATGILILIYLLFIKKDKFVFKEEWPKYTGAICETIGQFAYIFVVSDEQHLVMAAPIISSYCVASVVWSRIFLKEKLTWKHYACIGVVAVGIAIMGLLDP